MKNLLAATCLLPLWASPAMAQFAIGTGDVAETYESFCASCHGSGSNGGNLFDDEWKYGGSPEDIARNIKQGLTDVGMPAYPNFSDEEIRALTVYILEQGALAKGLGQPTTPPVVDGTYDTPMGKVTVATLFEAEGSLWAVEPFPREDEKFLLTRKSGDLIVFEDGALTTVSGTPATDDGGQGGYMDVAFDPKYRRNGWVYLAFTDFIEVDGERRMMTAIDRGRINDGAWVDSEPVFRAPEAHYTRRGFHYGVKIAFDNKGNLFFGIGDRGEQAPSQDPASTIGKTHRIRPDGTVPTDNPGMGQAGDAYPTIYSGGHRNPQGLAWDKRRRILWEVEHGPRGGDEVNIIRAGRNYGWPEVTYGINYNGTPMNAVTEKEGTEPPVHYWTPSIAVSAIEPYVGRAIPALKGKLLVAALASQDLRALTVEGEAITADEVVLDNRGRLRDLKVLPSGEILLLVASRASSGLNAGSRLLLVSPAR